MSDVSNIEEEVGAITVKEFGARYRLGHTKIHEEISAGRLRAVKCGARTLILVRDAVAWERSLPTLAGA